MLFSTLQAISAQSVLLAFSARVRWMIPWLEYIGPLSVVRLPSNLDSDVSTCIALQAD